MRPASAMIFGSSITTHCQLLRFRPLGAWKAISTHSVIRLRGTGLVRSRRLRTDRVVVRTSSGLSISAIVSYLCYSNLTSYCGLSGREHKIAGIAHLLVYTVQVLHSRRVRLRPIPVGDALQSPRNIS